MSNGKVQLNGTKKGKETIEMGFNQSALLKKKLYKNNFPMRFLIIFNNPFA